jgi:hypothetical protein
VATVDALVDMVALSLPMLLEVESLEDVLALPGDTGPLGLSRRVWISTLTTGAGLTASTIVFEKASDQLGRRRGLIVLVSVEMGIVKRVVIDVVNGCRKR